MPQNKSMEEAIKYVEGQLEGKTPEEQSIIIQKHVNQSMDATAAQIETMMEMHKMLGKSPHINPEEANMKSAMRLYNACRVLVQTYNNEN